MRVITLLLFPEATIPFEMSWFTTKVATIFVFLVLGIIVILPIPVTPRIFYEHKNDKSENNYIETE